MLLRAAATLAAAVAVAQRDRRVGVSDEDSWRRPSADVLRERWSGFAGATRPSDA
jgi:hypothetical protein